MCKLKKKKYLKKNYKKIKKKSFYMKEEKCDKRAGIMRGKNKVDKISEVRVDIMKRAIKTI